MLADGAVDGVGAAGARAAAPGDFIPVNRVILCVEGRCEQAQRQSDATCSFQDIHRHVQGLMMLLTNGGRTQVAVDRHGFV